MESIRQKQIAELVRRHFSNLLTVEGGNIYGRNKLVTVTNVKMTPDLLAAKIYVSVYGVENKLEVVQALDAHNHQLRQALSSRLGGRLRRMPELEFFIDETVDEMYRVQDLLNRIKEEDENIHKDL